MSATTAASRAVQKIEADIIGRPIVVEELDRYVGKEEWRKMVRVHWHRIIAEEIRKELEK